MSYRIYWSEENPNSETCDCEDCSKLEPYAQDYEELVDALNFCAKLRQDPSNRFVTMVAEDPNCTSLSGVSATSSEYDWKKRRGGRK